MHLRNALAMVVASLLVAACGDDPVEMVDGGVDLGVDSDGGGDAQVADLGASCPTPRASTLGDNFFVEVSEESGITDENYYMYPPPDAGPTDGGAVDAGEVSDADVFDAEVDAGAVDAGFDAGAPDLGSADAGRPRPALIPLNDHSRIGMADINGDGCDDAFMHSLYPNWTADNGMGGTYMIPFEHLVFLGHCDGTFTNFSDESGLRDVQVAFFVFGDVDNDGDQDCYGGLDTPITGRANVLLLNDGAGHFTVRASSGLEGPAGNVVAGNAVFADFNNDAHLDLFVGNGHTSYAAQDNLYFGRGDGTFMNVTSHLSFNTQTISNGSVACDYDNDGDTDIFVSTYGVSNVGAPDVLWENDGEGNFQNVAVDRGVASQAQGNPWLMMNGVDTSSEPGRNASNYTGGNGFGVQCEDVDNDGDLDIFLANISHPVASDYSRKWSDPTSLYVNGGAESGYSFVNVAEARGLPFNEGDIDAAMVDFDNDGLLDLAVTRDKKYQAAYTNEEQQGFFGLMHQMTNGNFESVGMRSGINTSPAFLTSATGQGVAWSDIDHDGDLDVLLGERNGSAGHINQLFRNDIPLGNSWLQVRLVGDGVHVTRDAFGARVSVVYNGFAISRELKSSRGTYSSSDSRTLHFGLGTLSCDYMVVVRWPDGTLATYSAAQVALNQFITINYTDGVHIDAPST